MADQDPDVQLCYDLSVICGRLKMAVHTGADKLNKTERRHLQEAKRVLLLRHTAQGKLIGGEHG